MGRASYLLLIKVFPCVLSYQRRAQPVTPSSSTWWLFLPMFPRILLISWYHLSSCLIDPSVLLRNIIQKDIPLSQTGLNLRESPVSASNMLPLMAYTTTSLCATLFYIYWDDHIVCILHSGDIVHLFTDLCVEYACIFEIYSIDLGEKSFSYYVRFSLFIFGHDIFLHLSVLLYNVLLYIFLIFW